jgi:hypothetical protein
MATGMLAGDAFNVFATAGDEGDARAAPIELAHERET